MQETIDDLIRKGQSFSFENNSYRVSHGVYTRASSDFLSWIAIIEDFVLNNYGEDSAPYKLYQRFDRKKLSGYEKNDFDEEIEKLFGVLISCKSILPIKKKGKDDNPIISLLKNPMFWTVIVVLMGGAFTLGIYFGSTKFDKEKINYERENVSLRKSMDSLQIKFNKTSEDNQSLQSKLKLYEKDNTHKETIQSLTKLLEESISKARLMSSKYDKKMYENWKEEVLIVLDKIYKNNYEIKARSYFIEKIKECEKESSSISPKQYECAMETLQKVILMMN